MNHNFPRPILIARHFQNHPMRPGRQHQAGWSVPDKLPINKHICTWSNGRDMHHPLLGSASWRTRSFYDDRRLLQKRRLLGRQLISLELGNVARNLRTGTQMKQLLACTPTPRRDFTAIGQEDPRRCPGGLPYGWGPGFRQRRPDQAGGSRFRTCAIDMNADRDGAQGTV